MSDQATHLVGEEKGMNTRDLITDSEALRQRAKAIDTELAIIRDLMAARVLNLEALVDEAMTSYHLAGAEVSGGLGVAHGKTGYKPIEVTPRLGHTGMDWSKCLEQKCVSVGKALRDVWLGPTE